MDSDRKLALTVAAVVAVGLASIVGLSLMGREEPTAPGIAPARLPATTEPATAQVRPASVPATPAVPEPVSAGTPEEAEAYQVEPGVNYLARGIEKFQAREFGHAVAYLLAEVEARPDRPYPQYLLGLALWKDGRLDEAAEAMDRAAELDGAAIKTFVNLSRIQNDRGDYDHALEAAEKAVALDPENAGAQFLRGRSLHNLGEQEEAGAALAVSLESDPDNGYVWNLLGLTLLAQDKDLDALEAFRTAASLETEVAYIQNNLGMAMELNGFREEAVAAYRRAVELDAGHERAAVNLARLEPLVDVPDVPAVEADEGAVAVAEVQPPEDGTD
ncbi:MAG: tetratricopeptide repeat protein [Acidobacteriota bacterium]